MKYRRAIGISLVALLVALSSASAATHTPLSPASPYLQRPEVQTYQGIPYLSGGIGLAERDSLRELGQDYTLKLVFALKAGDYLANVPVTVEDYTGQEVLQAVAEGPWLYTKLPPGRYSVTAQADGQTQQQDILVHAQGQAQLHFAW